MFTVEYAANFEVLLPALAAWACRCRSAARRTIFRAPCWRRSAAWDPFNVTEDADLGIRLARFGYRTATILSRTYEEAPVTFRQWLPQRRRWIKGWMQTVALCLGRAHPAGPAAAARASSLAVHGILTAGVLGLLLYPGLALASIAAAIARRAERQLARQPAACRCCSSSTSAISSPCCRRPQSRRCAGCRRAGAAPRLA